MKNTKALSLLLLVVTVFAMTNRRTEKLHVAGAQRTLMTTEKIAGENAEADVNNHHSIPRGSWDSNDTIHAP